MWKKMKEFFKKAWEWIEAVWDKHDEQLAEMVSSLLPMVISVAFRNDLSGEQKKKAILDAVIDNASAAADTISNSMLNEAVEIAANRYNIQIGKLTVTKMDGALDAVREASVAFANNKLKITGNEAEEAGITVSNGDVE